MGSLENPLLHCDTIRELLKKIRAIHSELVDHENTLPKCEICWQNHAELNSLKGQLLLITQTNETNPFSTNDNLLKDVASYEDALEDTEEIQPVTMVVIKEEPLEQYCDGDQTNKSDMDSSESQGNQSDTDTDLDEMNPKQQKMSCPLCSKTFIQRKSLYNHIIICKKKHRRNENDHQIKDEYGNEVFECAYCNEEFNEKDEITKHVRDHVKDSEKSTETAKRVESIRCTICSKKVHTLNGLMQHMKIHEKKQTQKYKRSLERSRRKTPYSCNICEKYFRYPGALERHTEIRDASGLDCKNCDEKFCRSRDLDSHQRIAHPKKTETHQYHRCQHCSEQFTNFKSIHKHHKTNHPTLQGPTKPYLCDTCGLAMMDSAHLKRHTMIHEGIKPHVCEVCDKAFRLKAELKQHRRVHIPASEIEEKYACPMCPLKFRTNVTLWRHKRFHSGKAVETFCPVCKLRITNPKSLEKHLQRHACKGPRQFKCEECGKTFTKLKYMNQHRKVDHQIFTRLMLNPKS